MVLRDWQSARMRKTVAQVNEEERNREVKIRPRHLILMFGLGFVAAMLLMGCAAQPSPELIYWNCVTEKFSYVLCKDKEVIQ